MAFSGAECGHKVECFKKEKKLNAIPIKIVYKFNLPLTLIIHTLASHRIARAGPDRAGPGNNEARSWWTHFFSSRGREERRTISNKMATLHCCVVLCMGCINNYKTPAIMAIIQPSRTLAGPFLSVAGIGSWLSVAVGNCDFSFFESVGAPFCGELLPVCRYRVK